MKTGGLMVAFFNELFGIIIIRKDSAKRLWLPAAFWAWIKGQTFHVGHK